MLSIQSQLLLQQHNKILSKTHLRYKRDISNHIKKFMYLIPWSDKYRAEIHGMNKCDLLQASDIKLNISLKPKTQFELCEKFISDNRNTFQTRYGMPYKTICIGFDASSKLDVIFKFCF